MSFAELLSQHDGTFFLGWHARCGPHRPAEEGDMTAARAPIRRSETCPPKFTDWPPGSSWEGCSATTTIDWSWPVPLHQLWHRHCDPRRPLPPSPISRSSSPPSDPRHSCSSTPLSTQAAPRNVFCGHLIGVVAGFLALVLFGLTDVGANLEDVTWPRVGAVAVALCLTLSVMCGWGAACPGWGDHPDRRARSDENPWQLFIPDGRRGADDCPRPLRSTGLAGLPVPWWNPRTAAAD